MQLNFALAATLALLVATSCTCVGLLSLWAATAKLNWFLRTLVFLAVLSPLLLVPAYELFIAFLIQGVVVACGVRASRGWTRRKSRVNDELAGSNSQPRAGFHFSLSSLLLLMALVAMLTPIAVRLPSLNLRAWSSIVAVGFSCGVATLIAAHMALSRRKLIAWPIALLLCLGIGFALSKVEWIAYSIVLQQDWPPTDPPASPAYYSLTSSSPPSLHVWEATLPAIAVLLTLILLLAVGVVGRGRRIARSVAGIAIVLIAAFPAFVLWKLLHPLAIPQTHLPVPNAYDDFVAAGKAFNSSPILNTTVEPNTTQLAAEVAKYAASFARVHKALTMPCEAPVWTPNSQPLPIAFAMPDIQSIRGAARAMSLESRLAQQQSRFRDAAVGSIDIMRVGQASLRGGLIIHYLVGVAVEGIGQRQLYPEIPLLNANECHEAIEMLIELDRNREPIDDVIHRDRIYDENATGWYGHLLLILSDIADARENVQSATRYAKNRVTTASRLLQIELALRQYFLEHGSYPSRLEMLVPKILPAIPIDPFDAREGPLRYTLNGDDHVTYSVGVDGDDDGGRPSSRESGFLEDGDIRLDTFFAPTDDQTTDGDDTVPDPQWDSLDPSESAP